MPAFQTTGIAFDLCFTGPREMMRETDAFKRFIQGVGVFAWTSAWLVMNDCVICINIF